MFGRAITLFRIFGFSVKVDVSWVMLAVLIAWSLASGLFPVRSPGLSKETYWLMGSAGALGLFLSIIFHELCHSLVAKKYGLPISGITLFIFGGVSEMTEEPESPKVEFLMAVAGPLSSIFLAVALGGVAAATTGKWPVPVEAVIHYLSWINGVLAAFNLLPAFPLDGGRVLRSALWKWKQSLQWATRVAGRVGSAFGLGMILMGLFSLITGNFIGGLWLFLIGIFLRNASQGSYRQLLVKKAFEGERVRRFMKRDPVTVAPSTTLEGLVDHYVYRYHYKMYPVVEKGRLLGVVTIQQVKAIPKGEWGQYTVAQIANQCTEGNMVGPDADAMETLAQMSRTGLSRLLVVDKGRLVGIITLKDMLSFLSLKLDFEKPEQEADA